MIYVCDAIMGTGKSQAAINYMNEHSDCKFVYITPYLDEAKRIKDGCPDMNFIEPTNKIKKYGHRKMTHTAFLIKEGQNITTTHQAFKNYSAEMLEDLKNKEYKLIVDEALDIFESLDISPDDIKVALKAGLISFNNGVYTSADTDYSGRCFSELVSTISRRELLQIEGKDGGAYYWMLPVDLLNAFQDVFILTYLFDSCSMHHMLKMNSVQFEYIGVKKTDYGTGFAFTKSDGYIPEYVNNLSNMIHIVEGKVNDVGDSKCALSMNWFQNNPEGVEQLRKGVLNYFTNICLHAPPASKLWGTFNGGYAKVRGKGFYKSFLPFNSRATNAYRTRTHLAYLAIVFMNVGERLFYQAHGVEVDEDMYALSIMVQWIWRSAIRDGKEITLYIPSKRMRTILQNWIDNPVVMRKG